MATRKGLLVIALLLSSCSYFIHPEVDFKLNETGMGWVWKNRPVDLFCNICKTRCRWEYIHREPGEAGWVQELGGPKDLYEPSSNCVESPTGN